MSLYRSAATIGFYTFISRVTGYVRDILIASIMGAGMLTDTFFVAFKGPNFFRRLFAEGAFNAAFIPMFSSIMAGEGKEAAVRFAEKVFAIMLTTLFFFTIFMMVAMPYVMHVMAPGFVKNPEQFELAVLLTRITFPYLLFISLASLLGGMLNSVDKFGAAAMAPIALNICLTLAILLLPKYTDTPAHALSYGVFVAGVLQFIWLLISCKRAGILPRFVKPSLSPQVKKMLKLMVPGVVGSGVVHLNLWVDTMIATLIPGAVSYLYYADRVNQLPMAIVGTAIGTVLLPTLSRAFREKKHAEAIHTQNRALEMAMLFIMPSAVGIGVIALPIISMLFERGAFSHEDAVATSYGLIAYAIGLPAYVLVKVFTPGFYANHNTKTPVQIAVACMILNVVFNIIFIFALKKIGFYPHVGIAMATTLAAWLNVALLLSGLVKRGHFKADTTLYKKLYKMMVATVAMGLALWGVRELTEDYLDNGELLRSLAVCTMMGVSLVVYFGLVFAFKVFGFSEMKKILKRQPKKHSGT